MTLVSKIIFLATISHGFAIGLEGTWQSKSKTVITGPAIYDPIDELIYEPRLPGMAYSFDSDGNWEQAIYQVSSNPTQHECPTAIILWQHGKYQLKEDGTLTLQPYPSDGRQLFSDPCKNDESIYMRYNQEETLNKFHIEYDYYNSKYKLQLYGFDGSKKQPLWLEYLPPVMLPTKPLNPTNQAEKHSLLNINKRLKRSIENRSKVRLKRLNKIDTIIFHFVAITGLTLVALTLFFLIRNFKQQMLKNTKVVVTMNR